MVSPSSDTSQVVGKKAALKVSRIVRYIYRKTGLKVLGKIASSCLKISLQKHMKMIWAVVVDHKI